METIHLAWRYGAQIGVRLYASNNKDKRTAELERHGIWGLFHLFSEAKFVSQGGAQYQTQWNLPAQGAESLAVKNPDQSG